MDSFIDGLKVMNYTPYLLSVGVSAIGLYIGSLFSDNESLLEFQKHMDQESYFQEMLELFVKKDSFYEILQILLIGVAISSVGYTLLLIRYLKRIHDLKSTKLMDEVDGKLQRMEDVIEMILKDNDSLDAKQVKLFKDEIEQQRNSFNDLITNKSLELETKLSDVKNTCIKVKNLVHVDYKKISEISSKFTNVNDSISEISQNVENNLKKLKDLEKVVDESINNVNGDLKKEFVKFNEISGSLQEQNALVNLNISKCNAMLTNTKILFDAAMAKSSNSDENTNEYLKDAVQLSDFLASSNSDLSKELPFHNNSFNNSINALVFELMKKLSNVEDKLTNHLSMINKNTNKIKRLDSQTNEKLSNLKFYSDEWITAWVSVIYSLFNSSFLHLETQLFGIDCMEYPTIFNFKDLELNKHSQMVYEIMDQCKETCLKIVKEVNLLIFEYYLVQTTYTNSNTSLLSICYAKIDDELRNLFADFENIVKKSDIPLAKQSDIINTLFRLKCDLSSDLKSDTDRFNKLVKQNLDDFYLIHDTMKTIFKESNNPAVDKSNVSVGYDSVIELSDNSHSIISVSHEDSSFSENDSSMSVDESSLRPFKLNSAKRKSRDLDFVEL